MASTSTDPRKTNDRTDEASETTPLLGAAEQVPPSYSSDEPIPSQANGHATPQDASAQPSPEESPMPIPQILLLCFSAIAEPIAYFAIFPFINEMLSRTGGVPEPDVGFYSGLIESLFVSLMDITPIAETPRGFCLRHLLIYPFIFAVPRANGSHDLLRPRRRPCRAQTHLSLQFDRDRGSDSGVRDEPDAGGDGGVAVCGGGVCGECGYGADDD